MAAEIERPARHPARRADGLRGPDRRRRRPASRAGRCAAPRSARCRRLGARDPRAACREIVAAVREALAERGAELEFVNGGGTGSLARTAAAGIVAELTAGSGFYAPALFDNYRSLELEPAAFFACRSSAARSAASPPCSAAATSPRARRARDRLPEPYLPGGLRLDRQEGAGEVQTPVHRRRRLPAADRRPRLPAPREGGRALRALRLALPGRGRRGSSTRSPTYRGEGKAFL